MKTPVLESLFNKIAGLIFRVIGRDQWHELDFSRVAFKEAAPFEKPSCFCGSIYFDKKAVQPFPVF